MKPLCLALLFSAACLSLGSSPGAARPAVLPAAGAVALAPPAPRYPDPGLLRYRKAQLRRATRTLLRIALGNFLALGAGYALARAFSKRSGGLPEWTIGAFVIPFALLMLALLAIALLWLWHWARLLAGLIRRRSWRRRFARCYRF